MLLSKHDYDLIQQELQDARSEAETAFLMRGDNGKRLTESIAQHKAGNVVTKTMEELESMATDDEG